MRIYINPCTHKKCLEKEAGTHINLVSQYLVPDHFAAMCIPIVFPKACIPVFQKHAFPRKCCHLSNSLCTKGNGFQRELGWFSEASHCLSLYPTILHCPGSCILSSLGCYRQLTLLFSFILQQNYADTCTKCILHVQDLVIE